MANSNQLPEPTNLHENLRNSLLTQGVSDQRRSNKSIVPDLSSDKKPSGDSQKFSIDGIVRSKAEVQNFFLSDYNLKEEQQKRTEFLLAKVRIDSKIKNISQLDIDFLIRNAESDGYFYEFSKFFQFMQIRDIKKNIDGAMVEVKRLLERLSEEEMFIQNLSNEEVQSKVSEMANSSGTESDGLLDKSSGGLHYIRSLRKIDIIKLLTEKERWRAVAKKCIFQIENLKDKVFKIMKGKLENIKLEKPLHKKFL